MTFDQWYEKERLQYWLMCADKEMCRGIWQAAIESTESDKQEAVKPLTDAQIEAGWHQTFSTSNPYCPCNLKSFTKAVRWAEHAKEKK